jgi:GxxExxY protein
MTFITNSAPGFLESVYEEALLFALEAAGLRVARQVPVPVWFRGHKVGDFFADLLVENKVILELKTARNIDSAHEAQLLHYLKATIFEVGLILNFGPRPQFRRLLLDNEQKLRRPKKEEKDPC